jgi:hypothetical protein
MTNAELAAELLRQADDAMVLRKQLLCAATVLRNTKTIPAAKRALREWDGPSEIVARAVELLDQLSEGE